jgi:Tfp pilus assembly protein PilF
MILTIIIVLSIALVVLLVDWTKVVRRFPALQSLLKKGQGLVLGQNQKKQAKQQAITVTSRDIAQQRVVPETAIQSAPKADRASSSNPVTDELLEKADVHFRKGELKAAEELYLKVAAADPRNARAYGRLGVIYLETGEDWADAEAAFRQALKIEPENGFMLNNLGLVLYHQDRYADAIRSFESAVRIDEVNANRHANLGKAYLAMRQYAKAESAFKRALKLAPNEMEYKDLLEEALEKKIAHKSMIRR